jgi:hypothetical protein
MMCRVEDLEDFAERPDDDDLFLEELVGRAAGTLG